MDRTKLPIPAQSAYGTSIPTPDAQSDQPRITDTVWLSVEQIRKRERMRRERVIEAMKSGVLPFEQRGRNRYARLCDVIRWEESRLRFSSQAPKVLRRDLTDLL